MINSSNKPITSINERRRFTGPTKFLFPLGIGPVVWFVDPFLDTPASYLAFP